MKKIALAAFALMVGSLVAAQVQFPQTLPSSTVWGRLGISAGPGQAIPFSILTGNLLSSITGGLTCTSAGVCTFANAPANTVIGNSTGSSAAPGNVSIPSCTDTGGQHLNYTSGTGFGCGTSVAPTLNFPTPGGRLTLTNSTPVMTTTVTGATNLFYAPYKGLAFIPIYNGTIVQLYQFTSSATDLLGLTLSLGSNWAANTVYDVFVALNSGAPVLCTVAWSSGTARATALALYDGLTVNGALATCRISNSATISMAQYQGTHVGTILTDASSAGQITMSFGGAGSGGHAGRLAIWNRYNRVPMLAITDDQSARYTYTSLTIRQCNASAQMQIDYVMGDVDGSLELVLFDNMATVAVTGAAGGISFGVDTTSAVSLLPATSAVAPTANVFSIDQHARVDLTPTQLGAPSPWIGHHFIACEQQSDGSHANTFNNVNNNFMSVRAMM